MATQPAPDFNHITTVIFDMDGTLIEHTWQLERICDALFSRFEQQLAPVTKDEFFECYWGKSADTWFMMVDGVLDGDTASRYGYTNTLRMLGQDEALAEDMLATWHELVLKEAQPFEDTYQVLQAVKTRYTTGILTNGFINLQRKKIDKYDFDKFVDFTVVSEEAGYHKPDSRVFEVVLKMAQAGPAETIYVGDNPTADIKGALAAGITPIFMNPRNDATPPDGVLKIKSLSSLLPLLKL